jgi:hypothetical protein
MPRFPRSSRVMDPYVKTSHTPCVRRVSMEHVPDSLEGPRSERPHEEVPKPKLVGLTSTDHIAKAETFTSEVMTLPLGICKE